MGLQGNASLTITEIRIEHHREALGIGAARPRLSWTVSTEINNWRQNAYEIELSGPDGAVRNQTGWIDSDQSIFVDWPFAPLTSRQQVYVRVRIRGVDGSISAWSAPKSIEAGLLIPGDWSARFITPGWDEDTNQAQPAPLLRREFTVRAAVKHARLYITAQGVYEAQINGAVVGDHVMAPGWTSYNHRLRYQTFDVTSLVHEGQNALGAMLGDGWYRGRLSFGGGYRNLYGDRLALLAQLEIAYADGTTERFVTDEAWRATRGPIRTSDIYDGEMYDARLDQPGWSRAGYSDADWSRVRTVERDLAALEAPLGPPVRRLQVVAPVAILTSPTGRTLLDFGQNLVGRLRLKVRGPAGHTITLRHAEVLEDGELGIRPLRTAKATDTYILRGDGVETWEPRFTFHGFRYAEVEHWPGQLTLNDIHAVVCHSDMVRTGWFECSDSLLSRLHENVVWSMRGNFFDIPTDCPQRDERLGWTGDIQVFSPAASFIFDTSGFLASWLKDLALEQKDAGGVVPVVIPNTLPGPVLYAAAWGDAAVVVPWVQYQRFGDTRLLADQFESMRSWVDRIANLAGPRRLWDQGFQFGDWLDPSAPPDHPEAALTDKHLIATAYFARSAELVSLAAGIIGREKEAAYYQNLAQEVRTAFTREYTTQAGRLLSDAQTAYALALEFNLLPDPAQRKRAGERLIELVRANGYRIGTGFVGTPLICDALCSTGYFAAAYRLLMQRECPSWLYPVTMGATTIWERWDSLLPNGDVNPGEMTSFNHYALGAVADWLHRVVGGLAPAEPGYRRITIQPRPGGSLTAASARHVTPYGMAECSWKIQAGNIDITATIPPNTTATVVLPSTDQKPLAIGSGTYHWSYAYHDPDVIGAPTIDLPVAALMDDPRVWAAVIDVVGRLTGDPFSRVRLESQSATALRQALASLENADQLVAEISAALRAFANA